MRNKKVLHIVQGAAIAAVYVILVVLFGSVSFGPIQFRNAEALTIHPFFTPTAIPGLFTWRRNTGGYYFWKFRNADWCCRFLCTAQKQVVSTSAADCRQYFNCSFCT